VEPADESLSHFLVSPRGSIISGQFLRITILKATVRKLFFFFSPLSVPRGGAGLIFAMMPSLCWLPVRSLDVRLQRVRPTSN
jgi:hypothetical protein